MFTTVEYDGGGADNTAPLLYEDGLVKRERLRPLAAMVTDPMIYVTRLSSKRRILLREGEDSPFDLKLYVNHSRSKREKSRFTVEKRSDLLELYTRQKRIAGNELDKVQYVTLQFVADSETWIVGLEEEEHKDTGAVSVYLSLIALLLPRQLAEMWEMT